MVLSPIDFFKSLQISMKSGISIKNAKKFIKYFNGGYFEENTGLFRYTAPDFHF